MQSDHLFTSFVIRLQHWNNEYYTGIKLAKYHKHEENVTIDSWVRAQKKKNF